MPVSLITVLVDMVFRIQRGVRDLFGCDEPPRVVEYTSEALTQRVLNCAARLTCARFWTTVCPHPRAHQDLDAALQHMLHASQDLREFVSSQ